MCLSTTDYTDIHTFVFHRSHSHTCVYTDTHVFAYHMLNRHIFVYHISHRHTCVYLPQITQTYTHLFTICHNEKHIQQSAQKNKCLSTTYHTENRMCVFSTEHSYSLTNVLSDEG